MIEFEIPLRLVNGANERCHWAKKAKRAKEQRRMTGMVAAHQLSLAPAVFWPVNVTITRVGKRRMDSDGLAISAKHVRDGIADALEVNDGDESKVTWHYAQEIGTAYAVRVRIEAAK